MLHPFNDIHAKGDDKLRRDLPTPSTLPVPIARISTMARLWYLGFSVPKGDWAR